MEQTTLHPQIKKYKEENLDMATYFKRVNFSVFLRIATYLVAFTFLTEWLVDDTGAQLAIEIAVPIIYIFYLLLSYSKFNDEEITRAWDSTAKQAARLIGERDEASRMQAEAKQELSRKEAECKQLEKLVKHYEQIVSSAKDDAKQKSNLLEQKQAEIESALGKVKHSEGLLKQAKNLLDKKQAEIESAWGQVKRLQAELEQEKVSKQKAVAGASGRYKSLYESTLAELNELKASTRL